MSSTARSERARRAESPLRFGRPANAVLAGLGVVVGAWGAVGIPPGYVSPPMIWALLSAVLGTWGGNMLNDLGDRVLDRTAHPERPLPAGRLKATHGASWFVATWVLSLVAASLVSFGLVLFVALLMGWLAIYELVWKSQGLAGNMAVAVAAGALFPFGAVAVSGPFAAAGLMGLVAGLAHLGRELLKDAQDAGADAAYRATFAVTRGPAAAARLGSALLVLAVAVSPSFHWLLGWDTLYLLAVAPSAALFLLAARMGVKQPGRAQKLAKAAMVFALLAFGVGAWTAQ